MRWRPLFFGSLAVNLLIAGAWLTTRGRGHIDDGSAVTAATTVKTNVLVRRQFFTWSQVESPDYPTYVANLRSIHCPEQTIRDIIIADVNALYAQRFATELVTPEQQWWRTEPDTNVVRLAAQKARQIDDERRALLTSLLGANWESGDLVSLPRPSRPGVKLDGPVLGVLPVEVKQTVEEITVRSQEKLQAIVSASATQDPAVQAAELARLRHETRNELAKVLSPLQLEEYLLRYSQNANNLRSEIGALTHFNPTPDEFRAIFRATDLVDQQLQSLAGRNDPNAVLERNNLLQQREHALRFAVGENRYNEMVALREPAFRDAVASATEFGTPEAARVLYQINLATTQEQQAINGNTNLSAVGRALALKELELRQLQAQALAVGHDVPNDALEESAEMPPLPYGVAVVAEPNIRAHAYVFNVGDTVGSIAQRYGVSIQALRDANPDLNFRSLREGDRLNIPDKAQSAQPIRQ